MHRWLRGLRSFVSLLVPVALLAYVRRRASAAAIPFSPVFGGRRIGADFPERRALTTDEASAGEMDDMAAYARASDAGTGDTAEAFDPDAVDDAVRAFYERTADYRLLFRTRWHRGFRAGAALAAPFTARIEQLNLRGPSEPSVREMNSRFARLRSNADPREGARAWVRTVQGSGEAVFVALYASHERDGERFVNIAAPLPGSNLSTVLRISHLPLTGRDGDRTGVGDRVKVAADGANAGGDRTGVELRTRGRGDPGLYLVTPLGAFALPMDQRFRVWPADADGAPDPVDGRATLVATHEMCAFGRQFLTVEYAMWPESASAGGL